MNQKIKIGLYVVLTIAAVIFGSLFYSSYKKVNAAATGTNYPPDELSIESTNAVEMPATNPPTNVVASTNLPAPSDETNSVENTNVAAASNLAIPTAASFPDAQVARPPSTGRSTMFGYFGAFLLVALFLGLLIARDVSEYFGNQSVEFMFNDDGVGVKNPEYEEAEQQWANGHHLDAIRMMRDYLTRNPREQYVALRIAEIYEKDLKNHLAAALEYEEILKHKLPPDRWGWAAIHLCNLYSKLGKTDNAVALLRRIVNEYGETPAAEKARKRLSTFETVGEDALDGDLPDSIESLPPKPRKVEVEPPSNLPPGFRPKK